MPKQWKDETLGIERRSIKTVEREFTAKDPVELLEEHGLITAEEVEDTITRWPKDKVQRVAAELFDFLNQQDWRWEFKDKVPELRPFNSLASSSIRGDSSCSQLKCRLSKLEVLARHAALYADHLYLPLPVAHPDSGASLESMKIRLESSATSILYLRPLIESGIVRPIVPAMHYCKDCAASAVAGYKEFRKTVREQAELGLDRFTFTCIGSPIRGLALFLEMRGPEEYIEHGSLIRTYGNMPGWLPKRLAAGETYEVPAHLVRDAGLVEDIFGGIAGDVLFHQAYGSRCNATYLTDLPGEAEFLQLLSREDELSQRTAALCARMTHQLPLLSDLPLRAVLQIRKEFPRCFDVYRSTMTQIIREHVKASGRITDVEARQIYVDCLQPALAELQAQAEVEQSKWLKKSKTSIAVAVGVVSLGLSGVLQPSQVMGLLGGAMISKLIDQFADAPADQSVANKNLYFLLRVQNAARKHKKATDSPQS